MMLLMLFSEGSQPGLALEVIHFELSLRVQHIGAVDTKCRQK